MEEEKSTLKEEIRELTSAVKDSLEKGKSKKFRSFKTKLGKGKIRKGYLIVLEIAENKGINIRKEPVIDGTVKLDDTYHSITDLDIFYYQPFLGKTVPMIFQPKNKLNPWNPIKQGNETYGQKYVMAKMKSDIITGKKTQMKAGAIIMILLIIAGVIYFIFNRGGGIA